jgi:hypothetical protein
MNTEILTYLTFASGYTEGYLEVESESFESFKEGLKLFYEDYREEQAEILYSFYEKGYIFGKSTNEFNKAMNTIKASLN